MARKEHVWVIDDDHSIRWVLEKALQRDNMTVVTFDSGNRVLAALEKGEPDAIVADIRMPGINGLELLSRIRAGSPGLPVIIMTAHSDLDSAVSAYQGGAFEYLPKPFDVDEAVALVRRACDLHRQQVEHIDNGAPPPEIIGEAPAMQEVFRAIGRLSRSNITVLINGESGTGKELVARALHRHSPRSGKPFIALNMAAIPKDLLESELFGHERGAFTGAQASRQGRFEQADGGTLFLDEIGDMPPELQTRLLRVLAEGEFFRVGGRELISVDVRVLAATHQDLDALVAAGRFRADLLHRLDVVRLQLPPLRERGDDVQRLADRFLALAARQLDAPPKRLTASARTRLAAHAWPGNVRELENVCWRLAALAPGEAIAVADVDAAVGGGSREATVAADAGWEQALAQWTRRQLADDAEGLHTDARARFDRVLLETALAESGGHRAEAARRLGLGRNTLTRKLGPRRKR